MKQTYVKSYLVEDYFNTYSQQQGNNRMISFQDFMRAVHDLSLKIPQPELYKIYEEMGGT